MYVVVWRCHTTPVVVWGEARRSLMAGRDGVTQRPSSYGGLPLGRLRRRLAVSHNARRRLGASALMGVSHNARRCLAACPWAVYFSCVFTSEIL